MLRCAITDRTLFPGDESQRQTALCRQAALWAHRGFDLIQLREKDLDSAELAQLASRILAIITAASSPTRLLVNGSLQAALQSQAHGLHIPSLSPLLPDDVRRRYAALELPAPIVTVSCHNLAEIQIARRNRADAVLFSPVFGKTVSGQIVTPPTGIDALREACAAAAPIPVYALGGVTHENAAACLKAGAKGVAGIRLFV